MESPPIAVGPNQLGAFGGVRRLAYYCHTEGEQSPLGSPRATSVNWRRIEETLHTNGFEGTLQGSEMGSFAFEKHYRVKELAGIWGLSAKTVTRMFAEEDGVIRRLPERPGPASGNTPRFQFRRAWPYVFTKRLGNQSFQSPLPRRHPLRVISLGDLHAGMAKKPRNVLKRDTLQKHPNGKCIPKTMWPAILNSAPLPDSLHSVINLVRQVGTVLECAVKKRPLRREPIALIDRRLEASAQIRFQRLWLLNLFPLLRYERVDPKMFAFDRQDRIIADRIAHSHSSFEHQFEQQPKRFRVLGVRVGPAVQFQRSVQDLLYFLIGVGFFLLVDGPVRGHLIHQRLVDPVAAVRDPAESTGALRQQSPSTCPPFLQEIRRS